MPERLQAAAVGEDSQQPQLCPSRRKRQVNISLTPEQYAKFSESAGRLGLSMAGYGYAIVLKALESQSWEGGAAIPSQDEP